MIKNQTKPHSKEEARMQYGTVFNDDVNQDNSAK